MQLWDPYIQSDIDKLESVHIFVLKLVTHPWDVNYNDLIARLSESLKLAQVYKITRRDLPELTLFIVHLLILQFISTKYLVLLYRMLLMKPRCAPTVCPQ